MRTLVLILILLPSLGFGQVQIPNGDFETWGFYNTWTLDPAEWQCQNYQLATHVYPDSLPYEGDLAMRVYSWSFFEPLPGVAWIEIPMDAIPPSLDFAVKCFIEGADSVSVRIQFMNTQAGVTFIDEKWSSGASIPDWTMISMELDQIEPVLDLCRIEVQTGFGAFFNEGSPNSWISVDAMSFGNPNTIPENTGRIFAIGPNPSNDGLFRIFIETATSDLRLVLTDLNGKLIYEGFGADHHLEVQSGVYLFSVLSDGEVVETGRWMRE